LPAQGEKQFFLTNNDKAIKLWKLSEMQKKRTDPNTLNCHANSEAALKIPKLKVVETGVQPKLKKQYLKMHKYSITGVSLSPNGQNFLSNDELRINLWDFENNK
jgi:serine/threonine-protein phosphatase 2A regulatory subunit B